MSWEPGDAISIMGKTSLTVIIPVEIARVIGLKEQDKALKVTVEGNTIKLRRKD